MDAVTVIAAIAVVAVAVGCAVTAGRNRRRERRDVENMFGTQPDDRVWWDSQ
jgi:hypothetical protein